MNEKGFFMDFKMKVKKLLFEEVGFIPPNDVVNAAKRAIRAREQHGDKVKGGTRIGWVRARQLANKEKLSYNTIKRMYSFFVRHEGNKTISKDHRKFPWGDAGYTAWQIWGGDPAKKWVEGIIKKSKNYV